MAGALFPTRAGIWGFLLWCFLVVSCSEDDCYYCGKDITGGVTADADAKGITKESDIPTIDDAIGPDASTDDAQPDDLLDIEQPDADTIYDGMVEVPAGEFMMGCNEAVDTECDPSEKPYHAVTLSAYKIDKYEVTAGEYQECVDAGACNNDSEAEPQYASSTDDANCPLFMLGKEEFPMQCVTWYGAKAYCEWVGRRLPSEAEWEKAARGTDGRKYPWGNDPVSCDYAVINECGGSAGEVGSKEAGRSPYGAYDMAGNVQEHVNDWYNVDYYAYSPQQDPPGPGSGNMHVLRGGGFESSVGSYFRSSYRFASEPDEQHNGFGFRCAK